MLIMGVSYSIAYSGLPFSIYHSHTRTFSHIRCLALSSPHQTSLYLSTLISAFLFRGCLLLSSCKPFHNSLVFDILHATAPPQNILSIRSPICIYFTVTQFPLMHLSNSIHNTYLMKCT